MAAPLPRGSLAVLTTDASMRSSRVDPADRPTGRLVHAARGEVVVVIGAAPWKQGIAGTTPVEVLTRRGETAWIWDRYIRRV